VHLTHKSALQRISDRLQAYGTTLQRISGVFLQAWRLRSVCSGPEMFPATGLAVFYSVAAMPNSIF
jgi:hypothetical protein